MRGDDALHERCTGAQSILHLNGASRKHQPCAGNLAYPFEGTATWLDPSPTDELGCGLSVNVVWQMGGGSCPWQEEGSPGWVLLFWTRFVRSVGGSELRCGWMEAESRVAHRKRAGMGMRGALVGWWWDVQSWELGTSRVASGE